MRFLYHPEAGADVLKLEGEGYRHLFKARRHRIGEEIVLRNLQEDYLYGYEAAAIGRKEAELLLRWRRLEPVLPPHPFHLGWCVVDPKTVEKSLPALNELGVGRLSLVYCDRSQKNFRLDFERMRRILINSCQQCGRSRLMELERFDSLKEYLNAYPEGGVLDFGGDPLERGKLPQPILIGCEGGFSEAERDLFARQKVAVGRFVTPLVLRSETAATAVAAWAMEG